MSRTRGSRWAGNARRRSSSTEGPPRPLAFSHRRMSLKRGKVEEKVLGLLSGLILERKPDSARWECGNRGAISKGGGKRGKPGFGFPRFPRPGISTALRSCVGVPLSGGGFCRPAHALRLRMLANRSRLACCMSRAASVSDCIRARRSSSAQSRPGRRKASAAGNWRRIS